MYYVPLYLYIRDGGDILTCELAMLCMTTKVLKGAVRLGVAV